MALKKPFSIRFTREDLSPRILDRDLGEAFQRFVFEVLSLQTTSLQFTPAFGKDGCIDLYEIDGDAVKVVECKQIGADGQEEALRRWESVARVLERNLESSTGPPKGQAQFLPWFRTDQTIRSYTFCVSSLLGSLAQRQRVEETIKGTFFTFANTYPHLSHLKSITVSVLDWTDLLGCAQRMPSLLFRWFPATRPAGLVSIADLPPSGTFRSYLTSDKLPYYSLERHASTYGAPNEAALNETNILDSLSGIENTGLIISGAGGVGKTRLTLELGKAAASEGWTVLRASNQLRLSALEQLAETITPNDRVLLLVDYLETQRAFSDVVDLLNDLNDTYELTIRYVANCRLSYYPYVASIPRHKHACLSPPPQTADRQWLDDYRGMLVAHILESAGLSNHQRYLPICRSVPILAVFMSYLYQTGRELQLAELLDEADFGAWIAKRVQLSFGDTTIARGLAHTMMLFPLSATGFATLAENGMGAILDRLATDGWIERFEDDGESDGSWFTAHDILADRVIASYLSWIPETADRFVEEGIRLSYGAGALRSALASLQRLIEQPALLACPWRQIIFSAVTHYPRSWAEVRDVLVRTPLLGTGDRIELLAYQPLIWEGAERDRYFQNSLSYFAHWQIRQPDHGPQSPNTNILLEWMKKCITRLTDTNAPLTVGLLLNPVAVKSNVIEWFERHPFSFNNWWLLLAWLDADMPPEEISLWLWMWLSRYMVSYQAGGILKAWLLSGGERELINEALHGWLEEHVTARYALRVCEAWLKTGGDPKAIDHYLTRLVTEYGSDHSVGALIAKWLMSGGSREGIEGPMLVYLTANAEHNDAAFVLRAWVTMGGDLEIVARYCQKWLETHATESDASFLYRTWVRGGGDTDAVRPLMVRWAEAHAESDGASFVLNLLLNINVELVKIEGSLTRWLAVHGSEFGACYTILAWLRRGGSPELVRGLMPIWIDRNAGDYRLLDPGTNVHKGKDKNKHADRLLDDLLRIDFIAPKLISTLITTFGQSPPPKGWQRVFAKVLAAARQSNEAERFYEVCEACLMSYLSKESAPLMKVNPHQLDSLVMKLLCEWNSQDDKIAVRINELGRYWLGTNWSLGGFKEKKKIVVSNKASAFQNEVICRRLLGLFADGSEVSERHAKALVRLLRWISSWPPEKLALVQTPLQEWRAGINIANAAEIQEVLNSCVAQQQVCATVQSHDAAHQKEGPRLDLRPQTTG